MYFYDIYLTCKICRTHTHTQATFLCIVWGAHISVTMASYMLVHQSPNTSNCSGCGILSVSNCLTHRFIMLLCNVQVPLLAPLSTNTALIAHVHHGLCPVLVTSSRICWWLVAARLLTLLIHRESMYLCELLVSQW